MSLAESRCEPCEGNLRPLADAAVAVLLAEVPAWRLDDGKLVRSFTLENFASAMRLANRVAAIAEEEAHHPDIRVHGWNKVDLTIFTHAIGGLSRNDFVLAAKIDAATR